MGELHVPPLVQINPGAHWSVAVHVPDWATGAAHDHRFVPSQMPPSVNAALQPA
jgi:hypothetical protein